MNQWITNKEARPYVLRKEEFRNGNHTMYAVWWRHNYVVYSYGEHHIMWVFDPKVEVWFGNKDYIDKAVSRTTARHHSLTEPPNVDHWVDQVTLTRIRDLGWAGYLASRMTQQAA